MFWIFSRLGKVCIGRFQQRVLVTVPQLSLFGHVAAVILAILLNRTFTAVLVVLLRNTF